MSASRLVDKVAVQVSTPACTLRAHRGRNGCGLWILELLAQHRHLAVVHQDPSRLVVAVRASTFSMNDMVNHAPIEGSEDSEAWWDESKRIANKLPSYADASQLCRVPFL